MKIKELRKAKGLSQTAVAKDLGIAQNTYSYWELGKFEPSLADVKRLAEYFGVTVGELFGEEPSFLPVQVDKPQVFHVGRDMWRVSASIEEIEKSIDEDKDKLRETFFQIGYKLTLVKNCSLYTVLGYENIIDYASARFGFGKTTTYDLLNVYERTRDFFNPNQMDSKYKKYNQSQLVAMSGSHWASDSLVDFIESDDTVDDIKKYTRIWDRDYRVTGNRPEGKNLKEALAIENSKKEERAKEKALAESIAPGQIEIDVETGECVGEEPFVFNQGEEHEEKEFAQEEFNLSEGATTKTSYEFYEKKKFVSTPARLKGAIKDFFDSHAYYKVVFDAENSGLGVRVVPEEISGAITQHLIENWDVIFQNSGMGLEK